MHPTLRRLDNLAEHLAHDPHVEALLGLGSAGNETDRFDDHSDIDFFVVVDTPATKQRYLQDITWLDGLGGQVVYSFVNDPNGRKALLDDGLFLEYAIFTAPELAELSYTGARVIWSRLSIPQQGRAIPATAIDTVEFHLNEALTNLLVGLHRELRGEHLTATRFIQVHAIDRILALTRLNEGTLLDQPDPFEPTRRIERGHLTNELPLEQMITGYTRNLDAARTTLDWLATHYPTDPVIVSKIADLTAALAHRHDKLAAVLPGQGASQV
jgi:hypothetical protein